jgi:orotidine-5'-phosphate decarboxylase
MDAPQTSLPSEDAADHLIVALDFPSSAQALALVDRLEGRCRWFKVGLQLYLAEGPSIISTLRLRGFNVFLDLKLHDIPNTVAGAIRSLASSGASLLTVHGLGGSAMLAAAQRAADTPGAARLLAVTVLTSMDQHQLCGIGIQHTPADEVLKLARLAHAAGLPGMVCSPEEVSLLRAQLGNDPLLVVPGIRPAGGNAAPDDQRRVATPAAALAAGASMLVIGRPITEAIDPCKAFDAILSEMASELTRASLTGR